jgi:5'-methylthioadenosine phosphorylase
LLGNADKAKALVQAIAPKIGRRTHVCSKGCHTALDAALITHPDKRDPKMVAKLDAVAGRVLNK